MQINNFFFSITDSLGGAEQLIMKLAEKDKKESTICFFSKQSTSVWLDQEFKVVYCNGSFLKFLSICFNKKFNVIFSSHLMMNAMLGFLRTIGFLKVKKLICRESTTVFVRYKGFKLFKYKLAYFLGYNNIDLLITQTKLMKSILLNNIPYISKRVDVVTIPNPFDFPDGHMANESITLFENYIVSAGRLIPEKGFDVLIKAFSKIKNIKPELKLLILGEGPERKGLEKLISDEKLVDSVVLFGFVDNVYPYFKSAKSCVVSSRIEGFPNVLLQMMSQNNNVVSTLCAGGIDDLKGVVTCHIDDANALAESIIKVINNTSSENRMLFDEELEKRSVDNFIKKIYSLLKKN